jgi:hypothetical protein
MKMKLHSFNVAGDLHHATYYCNLMGWAEHVIYIGPDTALNTIVILRCPDKYEPTAAVRKLVKTKQQELDGKIEYVKVNVKEEKS